MTITLDTTYFVIMITEKKTAGVVIWRRTCKKVSTIQGFALKIYN
jgi:hypothetical protein